MLDGKIKAHFIDNHDDRVLSRRSVSAVPRVGDELRFSDANGEKYYLVIKVVFVYDEEIERVNIGCVLVA